MREYLPPRRKSITHTFRVGSPPTTVHWTISFYPDGRVGELFIDMHKFGAALRDWASRTAQLFSVLLQSGTSLTEACRLVRDQDMDPHGLVRGSTCVEQCTSILDAIAQELTCVYADSATNLSMLEEFAQRTTIRDLEENELNELTLPAS